MRISRKIDKKNHSVKIEDERRIKSQRVVAESQATREVPSVAGDFGPYLYLRAHAHSPQPTAQLRQTTARRRWGGSSLRRHSTTTTYDVRNMSTTTPYSKAHHILCAKSGANERQSEDVSIGADDLMGWPAEREGGSRLGRQAPCAGNTSLLYE